MKEYFLYNTDSNIAATLQLWQHEILTILQKYILQTMRHKIF